MAQVSSSRGVLSAGITSHSRVLTLSHVGHRVQQSVSAAASKEGQAGQGHCHGISEGKRLTACTGPMTCSSRRHRETTLFWLSCRQL